MANAVLDPGDYLDFSYVYKPGGAIAVDSSDPNAAAPDTNRTRKPTPKSDFKQTYAAVYADAACTLELWVWSKTAVKWFMVFQQAVATAYVEAPAVTSGGELVPVPGGMPYFLRVEANGGGATFVAVEFV